MSAQHASNVRVLVRVRPLSEREKRSGDTPCLTVRPHDVVVLPADQSTASSYTCDLCYAPQATQQMLFDTSGVKDLARAAFDGYRTCLFAYGQTGAGKTYTVIGGEPTRTPAAEDAGITSRAFAYLFDLIREQGPQVQSTVRISCSEIYQEHVFDLLGDQRSRQPLLVREHTSTGFYLEGSQSVPCKSVKTALKTLAHALQHRRIGAHDMNARSNRSHFMTELSVELRPASNTEDAVRHGRITIVDLAGSERLKVTNSEGRAAQEAGYINRSLYVLANVISGLVKSKGHLNAKAVPYRDSKLTKLLIASLGGQSLTMMIACVSGATSAAFETKQTLAFAIGVKLLKTRPVQMIAPEQKLIYELKQEVVRLRTENAELRRFMTAPSLSSRPRTESTDEPNSRQNAREGSHSAVEHNALVPMQLSRDSAHAFGQARDTPLRMPSIMKAPHKPKRKRFTLTSDLPRQAASFGPKQHKDGGPTHLLAALLKQQAKEKSQLRSPRIARKPRRVHETRVASRTESASPRDAHLRLQASMETVSEGVKQLESQLEQHKRTASTEHDEAAVRRLSEELRTAKCELGIQEQLQQLMLGAAAKRAAVGLDMHNSDQSMLEVAFSPQSVVLPKTSEHASRLAKTPSTVSYRTEHGTASSADDDEDYCDDFVLG